MTILLFDWCLIFVACVIVLRAALIGFFNEVFSAASFFFATGIAALYCRSLVRFLPVLSAASPVSLAAAFLILFIVVHFAIKVVQLLLSPVIRNGLFNSLDHSLGFFLGLLEAITVLFLLIVILHIQPFVDVRDILGKSRIAGFFLSCIPQTEAWFRSIIE